MSRIRVALIDDHPLVLAGVKAYLDTEPEIELVGQSNTARDALEMVSEVRPEVAVLDISLPDLSGIELAQRLMAETPGLKIIALTVHENRAYVQALLQAGASGYLLKRSAADELLRAIKAVAGGGIYLDPAVTAKAIPGRKRSTATTGFNAADLSPREAEVLRMTARGYSSKEVADVLKIGVKSIETYKARAAEKLGLKSRSDIIRFAAKIGWLDEE